jgi:hypothetical protein
MAAKIIRKEGKKLIIEITIDLEDSMLDSEEAIQAVVNKAGTLATEEALKQFDTQGEAIEIEGKPWRSKGQEQKFYQTPYGEIQCARHVYQHHGRGKTFCPLEQSARIIGSSTPRFAKQVGIKMACNAAREVQQDFLECQGRKISASFLQNLSQKVAGIAGQQETRWHYDLPNFQKATASIAISLDGTCMHLSKEGWREAMAGTISFYDAKGNRQHTIYLGATPEYGKAEFLRRFTTEIERVKAHFPNVKRIGLADGAESNWQFLTPHTQTQILDFYHASSYLGAVANAKYPKDKAAHKAWLEDRCHQLKHTAGAAEALYNEMVALQARKCTQKLPQHLRDKLGSAITYYKNHRHQMDYTSYTEHYFPIGSGVTEAACKTLIKQRFCLAGMRWKQPGATGILNLRALVLTAQRWTQFWQKINLFGVPSVAAALN